MHSSEYWIQKLNLQPHPEGGFFKETYRSVINTDEKSLHRGFAGKRKLSTVIYFLLRSGDISKFHRLRSDEMWFFHLGSATKVILIDQEGKKHTQMLGSNLEKTEHFQLLIPAGTIFGAEVHDEDSFSLISCMVSPGFEFTDFELFDREDLLQAYPNHKAIIEKFT